MHAIDVVLIADRHGPTGRAYSEYLFDAGFLFRKIFVVDFLSESADIIKWRNRLGTRVGWWLLQRSNRQAAHPERHLSQLTHIVQQRLPRRIDLFGEFPYERYALEVQHVASTGFHHPTFQHLLRGQTCRRFLYTDGGRVPPELTSDKSLCFLHVHPGVVPFVRGSDCLLWSYLIRGRPGASCFVMDSGIDKGAVLDTTEFDAIRFPELRAATLADPRSAYRALLYGYDPHLRAQLFARIVCRLNGRLDRISPVAQPQEGACTYYWMHEHLRRKVLLERVVSA